MVARPWGWPAAVLSVVASGFSFGGWLWLVRLPTARVLLPTAELAYVQGPPATPLALSIVAGVVTVGLAWLAVSVLLARGGGVDLTDALARSASAFLPLLLLSVDWGRLLVPAGSLTDPLVLVTFEGRWVWATGVGLTVGVLQARLFPAPRRRLGPSPGQLAVVVFLLVAGVYLALLPRAVLVGPTGDEPDYLLLAHSLVVDRDFDLTNNIAARDYLRFSPHLQPHARPGPHGGLYSVHRLGLPALIAPAYALALVGGWPVRIPVMVGLCLLAGLVVARTVSWLLELTGHAPASVWAGLAVAFSAPAFYYAYAIYPELPVALVVLEVLRWLARGTGGAPWLVGTALATLPWFHEKFLPLAVVLAACALGTVGRSARRTTGLLLPLAASAGLQAAYYSRLYGHPHPFGIHAGFAPLTAVHAGLIGLWLDRDHGLLVLAPVYLVAVAGLVVFCREQRRLAVLALVAPVSLYAVVGAYREWWGGFAPPPRYLVPVLPILTVPLAFGLRAALARGHALGLLLLTGLSSLVAVTAVVYPALQYRHAHPFRDLFPGLDWTRYFPGWVFPDDRTWPLTGLTVVVAGLLVWSLTRAIRLPAGGGRAALAGLGILLVVLGVILVGDRVSGAHGPHLSTEAANRELQTLLLRLERGGWADGSPPLRARPLVPPDSLRLVYEAERLPGQAPVTVADALAGNGFARAGERAGADLVFGPYETLPHGAYRALFRLRGEPRGAPGRVALLGVTAARGKVPIAVREVRGEDLAPDAYRDLGLDFRLDARAHDLEWRVRQERVGALRVDRISIIPLGLLPRPGDAAP